MLVPNEIRSARQCSGVPLYAVTTIFQLPLASLRKVAKRKSFSMGFCSGFCELLALVARVGANCLHMKARPEVAGVVSQ
jgi:hypothetical protein